MTLTPSNFPRDCAADELLTSDGSSLIITCHLGLDIPGDEECLMWVGVDMERRAWRNNK